MASSKSMPDASGLYEKLACSTRPISADSYNFYAKAGIIASQPTPESKGDFMPANKKTKPAARGSKPPAAMVSMMLTSWRLANSHATNW
jgi:hypothetical protein